MCALADSDDKVDVEEITRRIRENIKLRRESRTGQEGEAQDMVSDSEICDPSMDGATICLDGIQKELGYINYNWNIQNNDYFISSHRPFSGKALVKGRELIHGEVRRYVDPVVFKQAEFNGNIVRILNKTTKALEAVYSRSNERKNNVCHQEKMMDAQTACLKKDTESMRLDISRETLDISRGKFQEIGLNYFDFEEKFRGSSSDIRRGQLQFASYFKGCKNVLDIGCGRGEFLSILKEQGIGGSGIDLDEGMVEYCKSQGLDVARADSSSLSE